MEHYIVGVGASAGGMEAIHDLFDYMPHNTGFSFVVIQHLSPDYKSLMAELLSRHTQMQVIEAQDGMVVEPNCIYAIPSKKLMTIRNGRLNLNEKIKSNLPNNAIDVFFESLAEDKGNRAVGIILSGTGTDGTKGIEHIKQKGGLVVVQEPLSAAFDGMPNSAVATGIADIVVPPEMMGEELLEFMRDVPLVKSLNKLSEPDEKILYSVIGLLKDVTKLDFTNYKRPTLFRRLAKRMSEVGINDLASYRDYLTTHDDELGLLGKEFLINVTKFFRDPEAFDVLRTEAIPAIVSSMKPDDTLKVWVAACSSGEEAYSVGMVILEHLAKTGTPTNNFKIFATDIDTDALETASRGLYKENISRDVPAHLLQKYFVKEGTYFRVTPELRKHIVFANHDILKDPPFSHLNLVTCRNMFIYINSALQQKILRKFHFALKLNGFLMLGPSENISILKDSTEEVNRKWKLYRCISKTGLSESINFMVPLNESRLYPLAGKQPASSRNVMNHLSEIFKDTILEDRTMAVIFIDKDFNVKQAIGAYKSFLSFPEESFNFNLLKLVSSDLSVALGVGVRKAINENTRVELKNVVVHNKESVRHVNLVIKPYVKQNEYQQAFLCVVLDEDPFEKNQATKIIAERTISSEERIQELERDLTTTRENLQAIIEEMETSNEELQSSNEEMISTNEELQSTNEELQSLNEELHTVSAEHQLKIKELIELNDDLNNYFQNSDIGQILVDKELLVRKFSPKVTRMVNLIEADIGRSIVDITTNFKDFDLVSSIRNVVTNNNIVEREIVAADKFYFVRITPFVRRDGVIDGVVVSFTDVSESKKLTSIISSIFNISTDGITAKQAIRNEDNEIIDFEYLATNKAAQRIFGVKENLEGKRLTDVFGERSSQVMEVYTRVVETGKSTNFEFFDPERGRWYNVSAVKMLDGVVTTHTDITERRKAADLIARSYEDLKATTEQLKDSNTQLERSNYDLLQFASIASHDLKEPLRKIQAFGNILVDKVDGKLSTDERNYFQKIISSSQRMQVLIEDVLSLSKLSNSVLVKDQVDLNEVLNNIVDDLEISITEKKAMIEIGKLPVVYAVAGQMRQLFQNLISNALKFRDKEKSIPKIIIEEKPVSAKHAEELDIQPSAFTCICICDNGIGFEDEYKEKIFGIFQRLHGRKYEGTGIGLAIARKIVENHGGYIIGEGKLDEGAAFYVFIPKETGNS
jgi:two-component system CheB/CheR fusion protein